LRNSRRRASTSDCSKKLPSPDCWANCSCSTELQLFDGGARLPEQEIGLGLRTVLLQALAKRSEGLGLQPVELVVRTVELQLRVKKAQALLVLPRRKQRFGVGVDQGFRLRIALQGIAIDVQRTRTITSGSPGLGGQSGDHW